VFGFFKQAPARPPEAPLGWLVENCFRLCSLGKALLIQNRKLIHRGLPMR